MTLSEVFNRERKQPTAYCQLLIDSLRLYVWINYEVFQIHIPVRPPFCRKYAQENFTENNGK
jgi:hypothetical protein